MADKLSLYEDQLDVMEQLREGFRAGHRVQLLYAPTGAGKTEIAMALMKATADKERRAAMTLDRIVLCDQTSKRLDKYGIPHGVMQSGHWRYRPYERIQVCSAQTLEKRGDFPGLNLLIVDECHDQRKQTLAFLKNNTDVKGIGLSASPFTKGLGQTYTNVVSATTTSALVKIGRLVPLRVFIAKQVDMKGVKKVAGEFASDDASERGMRITGDVVNEWIKKTTEIFGGPRKTIVFCSNVAHGTDLAQKFAESGFNFVPISYLTDEDFKREAIQDFGRADTKIQGLIACDILTKGFDVPDVMIGISARPFAKSFSSHVQQMGRVMRSCADKEFALWLDHSGNYLRFQEDWDELYENGVQQLKDDAEKAKKEVTDKELEARRCPKCSSLWPAQSDTCPVCGHVKLRLNLVEQVDGELVELGAGASRAMKQEWWGQILTWGQTKNWSRGACSHRYREKFGVWPQGLSDAPAPMTAEVIGWLKMKQIAWARGRMKGMR
jgi:superfamily II DNA or RNA helicase